MRLGKPAATAALKKKAKVSKYVPLLEACDSTMDFCPFGVEIYGALGPKAKQVIQKLIEHAAHMGSPLLEHVGVGLFARQRVSYAVARGDERRREPAGTTIFTSLAVSILYVTSS